MLDWAFPEDGFTRDDLRMIEDAEIALRGTQSACERRTMLERFAQHWADGDPDDDLPVLIDRAEWRLSRLSLLSLS
jgi:hypothetical protein